jgi:hypothetical protein
VFALFVCGCVCVLFACFLFVNKLGFLASLQMRGVKSQSCLEKIQSNSSGKKLIMLQPEVLLVLELLGLALLLQVLARVRGSLSGEEGEMREPRTRAST